MALTNSLSTSSRPKKLLIQPSANSPFCVSPSQLQEVTLDPDATNLSRDISCFAPKSPGDLTSGRTVKEIDEQLSSLKKENFNLKLRLYFIEERMGSNLNVDNEDVIQKNIELQFELANLQKELDSKQELLCQAAKVMEIEDEEHKKDISEKNRELCCLKERIEEMRFQLEKEEKDNIHEELWTEAFNIDAQRSASSAMINKLQARIIELQNELKQTLEETHQLRSVAENAQTKWKHLELQIAPVDALKEELSKKSSIIDSLRRSSTQKDLELHDVKLQLKDIQNLYDSLIVRSEVDQSPSKSNNENTIGQMSSEEVTELKKNHFKACKIIKTMIHKKKDYVDQIEKLQKTVQQGSDEIQSLKKQICDITSNTQFESNKKSIKDKVSELNLTAGWHPSSSIEERAITEDHAPDLTTQYKILVDELEKKIEVLHATLQHKDSHIELLNVEIQEKANSIIDLEFELLAQVEGIDEHESNEEKQDVSKEKLLEEKDEVIQKLQGELRKRTGDLQGIVNTELWEKNRTIEKLETIIKGKEEALGKIEKTNNNTELQLKILKQRINELGIHINIPSELASSDDIEYHKEKDHHLLLQLEKSEKMRRDCQEICCILNNRLEELCHFLQSLLQHKSILGFLGHQQTQRLHEAVNKSLEFSQTLSNSILIDVDQSLQQLCNITNLLNSTRADSVIHSFEDDNSVLSIVPSDATLTYHNHLTSNNNERDLVIVLRDQIANLQQQLESRDSKLDKLTPETSQSLRMVHLDSESESWSEPDRSVSLARIGLQGDTLKCGNISSTNKSPSKRTTLVENKQTIMLLHEQISELQMKLTKSEERLNSSQLDYNELEKSLGHEQNKFLEISKQYEISQCDVENLKTQLSKLLVQIQDSNSELEKTKVEKFHVEQQLSQLKVTIESLEELKSTVHLSYDAKTKHMQNMLNEMEIEKTKVVQKAEDLETKLLETTKHLEQTEVELQHTQCKLENCKQRYTNELNSLNCKLQQQAIALKNLYDKESIIGKELQQTQNDNIKLTNHAEQLQVANRDSCSKILSLEEKMDNLLKQLDDVTLKNSELVLEKAKIKNENVILESKIIEARERNLLASQICISDLERKNLLLDSQLKNLNKGQILKYTLSSSLPNNLNVENLNWIYQRQVSDHSDYTLEEIQRNSDDYRSLSVHNVLDIVDDNERLQASSSPDLGIESDQGRLSSLENNAGIQRPLLPSLRIAQTVNNLLNSVENNICKSQSCNEQMERISNENVTLRKRLLRTKRTLDETLTRLTLANKQKKEVEKSICKQIHKTSQVLRKAKANLDSGSET